MTGFWDQPLKALSFIGWLQTGLLLITFPCDRVRTGLAEVIAARFVDELYCALRGLCIDQRSIDRAGGDDNR